MNNIQTIIKDICKKKEIEYRLVSKDWIMVLTKKNKTRYIVGYKFDLNDHASGQICDDKYALYDVLKKHHIPVAEHFIIFNNYNKEKIKEYSKKYNYNIVVKNNTGTCGNDMNHVLNEKELFSSIDHLLNKYYSISINPYYEIKNEYRTIILNGQVELFYGKKKPIVTGDGKKTIYELLLEFNEYYFKDFNESKELKRILKENEIYEFNWQFNLSKGSIPFFLENEIKKQQIIQLAVKVAQKLNLKFVSIDIIELETGEFLVLEANSGVMMESFIKLAENGREIATNIYEKAVEEMFK